MIKTLMSWRLLPLGQKMLDVKGDKITIPEEVLMNNISLELMIFFIF